jgi:hypothetical protein
MASATLRISNYFQQHVYICPSEIKVLAILVNESYINLIEHGGLTVDSRVHSIGVALINQRPRLAHHGDDVIHGDPRGGHNVVAQLCALNCQEGEVVLGGWWAIHGQYELTQVCAHYVLDRSVQSHGKV